MLSRVLAALLLCAVVHIASAADGWTTDYEKALAKAKAENKLVLLDFTGSDWCGPCIALSKNVFSKSDFASYAKKHFILVEIDYPMTKKLPAALKAQNSKLKKQYGIDQKGFPTVIAIKPDGSVVGEFGGYNGEGPADIIARLEKWRTGT